jgi:hypothetical protein
MIVLLSTVLIPNFSANKHNFDAVDMISSYFRASIIAYTSGFDTTAVLNNTTEFSIGLSAVNLRNAGDVRFLQPVDYAV